MAAGIPKRLAGPALAAATDTLIYTVPANRRSVVRHIHWVNSTGAAVTLTLSIGADAVATRWFDAYSLATGAVLDAFVYLPMEAAETLRARASAINTTLTVSGDEIALA